MQDGDIKYAMFCNDAGGIIDDFIVYRCAADDYWLVVNAGNRDKDAAWVEALRSCLQSQKIYDFILNNEDYKGGVIPAFTVEEKAE